MFRKRSVLEIMPLLIIVAMATAFLWSSPLSVGNPWVDTNVMLEIGKSWLSGIVPFRDVFEQRGPILYLVYALANVVSSTGYFGLFVVETLNLLAMYFAMRLILNATVDNKKSRYLALIMPIGMIASPAFQSGGSPEEFAAPLVLFAIYAVLKLIQQRNVNMYAILFGVMVALAFWMKYTTVIPFVALFAWWLIVDAKTNHLKQIMFSIGWMAIGFATITAMIVGYFWLVGGLTDLIDKYFIVNLTTYTGDASGLSRVIGSFKSLAYTAIRHWPSMLLGVLAVLLTLKNAQKKSVMIGLVSAWAFTFVVTNIMGVTYEYYYLLVLVVGLVLLTVAVSELALSKKALATIPALMVLPLLTNPYAQAVPYIWKSESLTAEKFAAEIKKDAAGKRASVLYYSTIATGIDRYVDTAHPFYFFEKTNIPRTTFPDQQNYLEEVVRNQEADYVVVGLNYSLPNNIDLTNQNDVMAAIPDNVADKYEVLAVGGTRFPERGSGVSWRMSRDFQTALLKRIN